MMSKSEEERTQQSVQHYVNALLNAEPKTKFIISSDEVHRRVVSILMMMEVNFACSSFDRSITVVSFP